MWRQRNDVLSISQCRHEEDMCANKHPKNDGCIFNGSRDIQQTSTLGPDIHLPGKTKCHLHS